jgi:hypothetical protein
MQEVHMRRGTAVFGAKPQCGTVKSSSSSGDQQDIAAECPAAAVDVDGD